MKAYFISSLLLLCAVVLASCMESSISVDKNQFTQLLSNHLLLDHYDKALSQLSKKISRQFRDAIQVKVKRLTKKKVNTPVDVQVLKRQLKGAVGSFVEDKLPYILTNNYNTVSLQKHINHLITDYCSLPPLGQEDMISQDCLMQHIHLILSEIETIATLQLQTTLMQANENDLPKLFEKTRAQISGILVHFNQHTMDENNRLELHVRRKSDEPIGLWITNEMMQEFMFAVNHTDTEEGDNVYHFLESSTVKTIHHLEG